MNRKKAVLILLLLAFLVILADIRPSQSVESDSVSNQKNETLEEYLEESKENWFLTGKKKYTIQAKMVSEEISFYNELEAVSYTVTDDGVTVVLKGTVGEMWTSSLSKVIANYTKPDSSSLCEDDFAERDVFIDIMTIPAPDTRFAMFVPNDISVTVITARGSELHTNLPNAPHGAGDYLICNVGEDGQPDLSDVWVVNGVLFSEYYDTSHQ